MTIAIPIITEFDGKGIDRAVKEFKNLETNGQKAQFAIKKAAGPAAAALAGLAVALAFASLVTLVVRLLIHMALVGIPLLFVSAVPILVSWMTSFLTAVSTMVVIAMLMVVVILLLHGLNL